MLAARKSLHLFTVALPAGGFIRAIPPHALRGLAGFGRVTVRAIDPAARMAGVGPVLGDTRVHGEASGCVAIGEGQGTHGLFLDLTFDRGPVAPGQERLGQGLGLVQVLDQEVLAEGAVVMVVVAAGARAALGGKAAMARAFLCDLRMAAEAMVLGDGETHSACEPRPVLAMTGDAAARVHDGQAVGVARVREQALGVGVFGGLERLAVAVDASRLQDRIAAVGLGVADRAGDLDLMMPAHARAGQEQAGIAAREGVVQPPGGSQGEDGPGGPVAPLAVGGLR